MRKHLWLLTLPMLAGCSGHVWHQPAVELKSGDKEKGIVYHDRFLAKRHFNFVNHVNSDGKADGVPCAPTLAYTDLAPMADYWHPKIIYYEPGLFEGYNFNPQIASDGTLSSATVDSKPDQGQTFKNTAEGIGALAAALPKFFMEPGKRPSAPPTPKEVACNGGPVLVALEKVGAPTLTGVILEKVGAPTLTGAALPSPSKP